LIRQQSIQKATGSEPVAFFVLPTTKTKLMGIYGYFKEGFFKNAISNDGERSSAAGNPEAEVFSAG